MIDRLEKIVGDIHALHNKLIVVVGDSWTTRSALLADLGKRLDAHVLIVGSELGRRLAVKPVKQRALAAPTILRELADQHASGDVLLLDNIELLFDRTLQLDPLDLLKRHAHARRVVAVWPGELRDGRLIYAEMGHPEHQDYGLEGLVPFAIQ